MAKTKRTRKIEVKKSKGWVWWLMFVAPVLRTLRQVDHKEFQASLGYGDLVSKTQKHKMKPNNPFKRNE